MIRRAIPVLGALLLAAPPATAIEGGPPAAAVEVRGTLEPRATWSGTVFVAADIEVPAGGGLVIEAGTRVILGARDLSNGGWNARRVEIHVKGDLLVAGTVERPVLFEPESGPPEIVAEAENTAGTSGRDRAADVKRYPWHGVVLWPVEGKAPRREIRGARFSSAFAAVQVPAGRVRIEDSVFLGCATGVEAGSAYADHERFGTKGGVARPTIARSRFAGCGTGVFAQSQGAPRIERSVFAYCVIGAGGGRTTGRAYPGSEPGVTVERCDFHGNRVGVQAPFLVGDCLFARNVKALALSGFHVAYATGVDEFRLRGSASFEDGETLRGESTGGGIRVLDQWPHGASTAEVSALVRAPWPPLAEGLRLDDASPARGLAGDGGDPGCLAEGIPRGALRADAKGGPLPPPLAAMVAGDASIPAEIGRQRPSPGAVFRSSWWSLAPPGEDGAVRLRGLGGAGGGVAALGWRLKSDRAGEAVLHVNGDLDACAAWWNGDALPAVPGPRRFGPGGSFALPVKLKGGINLLVVGARGRGPDPGLLVSLAPPDGVKVDTADPPPAAARDVTVSGATVGRVRGREGTWLRLALSAPVGWTAPGAVALLDGAGKPLPAGAARVVVDERQIVLFGPLPEEIPAGFLAVVSGFLGPDGTPCAFPPAPVPVKSEGR